MVDVQVIGTEIQKKFPGHGIFTGVVVGADNGLYQVQYTDGDEEELSPAEFAKLLSTATKKSKPTVSTCTPVDEAAKAGRVSKKINYSELSDGSEYEEDGDEEPEGSEYKPKKQKRRLNSTSSAAPKKALKSKARAKGPKLRNVLTSLDKKQLVDLIEKLAQDDAEIEEKVRDAMPEPDLGIDNLQLLRKKIFRAFPHTRWGSSRDNYSYGRVSPHIQTFKKEFNAKLSALQKSGALAPTLKFIEAAVELVDGLPNFDNEDKNKYITQMRTKLHKIGTAVIKKASKTSEVPDLPHFQKIVDALTPSTPSSED